MIKTNKERQKYTLYSVYGNTITAYLTTNLEDDIHSLKAHGIEEKKKNTYLNFTYRYKHMLNGTNRARLPMTHQLKDKKSGLH